MIESPVYRPYAEAPAVATLLTASSAASSHERQQPPDDAWSGLRRVHFEVVSRGDIVPGILDLPQETKTGGVPLVLIQHGLGACKDAPYLDFAARWVREGWAVARIDLPLHGERSSPKLSERLVSGMDRLIRNEPMDPDTAALVEEFARQSTSDLMRTREALCAHTEIDAAKIGFLGLSLGAVVGCYLLGHDAALRTAIFALSGGGFGPHGLDPANYLSGALCPDLGLDANRPILIVRADGDELVSASATKRLFEAALEPKTLCESEGDHGSLPGKTLREMRDFLRATLDR